MFRVIDNSDGTTTVICKETGSVVCVVGDKRNPSPRRLSISQPISRVVTPDTPALASNASSPAVCDENFAATTSDLVHEREPPLPPDDSVDYSDDCITQEEFLQTLNLISRDKFKDTPIEDLKEKFPYRNIGKVKPKPSCMAPDAKLYDGLPICCLSNEKRLKSEASTSKLLIKDPELIQSGLNKQANYCRTSLPHSDGGTNIPRLRCREQKLYSLTYRVSKTWKYLDHMYCFNKSQRKERILILKTGLNARGRMLLKKCIPLSVNVSQMSKSEVEKWTKRKIVPNRKVDVQAFYMKKSVGRPFKTPLSKHPGLVNIISDPDNYTHLKSRFDGLINHTAVVDITSKDRRQLLACYSSSNMEKKDLFKCKVLLSNVLWELAQYTDACYVERTLTKVNDIHLLPLVLWQRPARALNVKTFDNWHSAASERNGPYCHPPFVNQHQLFQTQRNSFANKDPRVQPACSHIEFRRPKPLPHVNGNRQKTFGDDQRVSSTQRNSIICIDLTKDDDQASRVDSTIGFTNEHSHRSNVGNPGNNSDSESNPVHAKVKEENASECSGAGKGSRKKNKAAVVNGSRALQSATNRCINGDSVSGSVRSNSKKSDSILEKAHSKRTLSNANASEDNNTNNHKRKKSNGIEAKGVSSKLSPYSFHCYECRHAIEFTEKGRSIQTVQKHMAEFHSGVQLQAFLKIIPQCKSHPSVLIERYPDIEH